MSKPMIRLLAGVALIFIAGTALAQSEHTARREAAEDTAATARPGARPEQVERRHVHIYRQGDHHHGAGHTGRMDHLSDILQLRPDQEPALKAFLEATHDDRGRHDHMVKFDRDARRTTLERLDDMQARMAEQQAEANRRIAAIKAFYGQLDAKQKAAFDAMPMLMMVGPSMGPMVIPHRIAAAHDMPPPPAPPEPPRPPRL